MDRKFDLALVKVDVPPGHALPVAKIGRSVDLRAGEFVVAMGSPQGLSKSCTLGIVSATARRRSELGKRSARRNYCCDCACVCVREREKRERGMRGGPCEGGVFCLYTARKRARVY